MNKDDYITCLLKTKNNEECRDVEQRFALKNIKWSNKHFKDRRNLRFLNMCAQSKTKDIKNMAIKYLKKAEEYLKSGKDLELKTNEHELRVLLSFCKK